MEEGIFTSTGLRQISHRRDDIDEAIRLADWALILRAGKFVVDLRIDSAHPRDRNDSYSLEHRRMLLAELGVGLQA